MLLNDVMTGWVGNSSLSLYGKKCYTKTYFVRDDY